MKTTEIRKTYLDFFASKGHKAVASDSLVPQNDPTLLFTGAGMNQFKDYFLGVKLDLKRATSSQKCLRTADLDEVGKTAYHHSFFEMLGNFSFGDYFKKEAIEWAWEFLTEVVKLPKERLRITVHQSDNEAFDIWDKHIGIRKDWIYRCGDKSNFWPANAPEDGPNGPCGPCSEIYFDQKPEMGVAGDIEDRRFAEIWNLVFTQFDRQAKHQLVPLANKNIDTGMGLERLACMLQGKKSNFEIDLFQPIHAQIRASLGVTESHAHKHNSLHAIADHARALTFTIADGVIPSNEGRGYVVRKILRRALWHGYQMRGNEKLKSPFMYQIIPTVVEAMKDAYPELEAAQASIQSTVQNEEKRFLETLDTGMGILGKHIHKLKHVGKTMLDAASSFELYDTYGFPDELTRMICEESGIVTDHAGFEKLMEEQRQRSKGSTQIAASIFTSSGLEKIPQNLTSTIFTGYQSFEEQAQILWFEKQDDKHASVILDRTPFYAESGGQVGDIGTIENKNLQLKVLDTKKLDRFNIHQVEILSGEIACGEKATAKVNIENRRAIMRNHTATHLLHAALRAELGNQVRQLGSLVASERLRFDYAHNQPLTVEQLQKIEDVVNQQILMNNALVKTEESIESARQSGAMAFFGEKYGDKVRVVTAGDFSKELCGGTHCNATGDIGSFVIVSDSSVASGVRRIEALTGFAAFEYFRELRGRINRLAETLRVPVKDVESRIQKLQEQVKAADKKKSSGALAGGQSAAQDAIKINNFSLVFQVLKDIEANDLRALSDSLKNQTENTIYFLAATDAEKLQIILGTSVKVTAGKLDVREVFKNLQTVLGLRGGGRPDFIQAGGACPQDVQERLAQAKTVLTDFMKAKV